MWKRVSVRREPRKTRFLPAVSWINKQIFLFQEEFPKSKVLRFVECPIIAWEGRGREAGAPRFVASAITLALFDSSFVASNSPGKTDGREGRKSLMEPLFFSRRECWSLSWNSWEREDIFRLKKKIKKLKLKAYHVTEDNKGRQMKDIQEHLFLFQLEKGREMDTN